MSEYRTRSSQDPNHYVASPQHGTQQYSNSDNSNFVYNGNSQYAFSPTSYHNYPTPYPSTYHLQSPYPTQSSQPAPQYHMASHPFGQTPAPQHLIAQRHQYQQQRPSSSNRHHSSSHPRHIPGQERSYTTETESQESPNEATMLSEPIIPPLEGFPKVRDFDQLMRSYVDELSPKKRDKALIHAGRAKNIKRVLLDPKDTAVESAQFRFWVKKMFTLQPNDGRTPDRKKRICHEGKPVAVREKLFKILTKAHQQCQHGGRDKTSQQVRRIYSWVPKELISRFVKLCPTCQVRRGGVRFTPPNSDAGSPESSNHSSPEMLSPPESRRESVMSSQSTAAHRVSQQTSGYNPHYQMPNLWMSTTQHGMSQSTFQNSQLDPLTPASMHTPSSIITPSMDEISQGMTNTQYAQQSLMYNMQNGMFSGTQNFKHEY